MKRILTLLITLTIGFATLYPTNPNRPAVPVRKPEKIGLALSGGGALGFAHIGAIQALEDKGVKIEAVSGSSMGAIIGVLYSAGLSPQEILQTIKEEKLYKIGKLLTMQSFLRNTGASSHATLEKELLHIIPHNNFEKLEREFIVCATNIDKGEAEYINKGNQLAQFVVASASIPGVFEAKVVNNTRYIDGGTLDNLPSRVLTDKGCDYIIGVDVLPFLHNQTRKNSIDVAIAAIRLSQHHNSEPGRQNCNFVVSPYAINEFHEFNFDKYLEIYQYGYKAMMQYLNTHPEVLNKITSLM